VDVNVHPTKAEVRFRQADAAFSAVERAVRQALTERNAVPQLETRHWSLGTEEPGRTGSGQAPRWEGLAASVSGVVAHSPQLFSNPPGSPSPSGQAPLPVPEVPLLRVVGQVGAAYIVAEGPDGLYLIDQHAAHERVLYEAFSLQRAAAQVVSQALLEPVAVEVPPEAAAMLYSQLDTLNQIGFSLEPFGGNTFLVRSLPTVLGAVDPARAVRVVVEDFEEDETLLAAEAEARLVARVCKRAAVKAGQTLTASEQAELVQRLERCVSPRTCPHGRPTMIHLSVEMLEKQFGRKG
jgi:DNA mismatch repair protein MutL